ncbi:hypothetical protein ACJIZ3_015566 [Penstemon smallii]|uniref:Uncharacterized protein n=1 Tax=Penstemon smallii TaxID=265156 RepID=A0ABD3RN16_9LAMI
MDLGCIDMGCVEKQRKETTLEKDNSPKVSVTSASKSGKSNRGKDAVRSSINALNKLTSQITKPPRRKTSPLNWIPRKKMEPYLKRKIKMLQEVDGMHLTLDETLHDSNPHYSRVLREKIAIREAAEKSMQARKAAMVEASWCRILQAARIESKEAEAQLSKAEAAASEALEAAKAVGVIMNEVSESSEIIHYKIEANFETAFEVDKQVAGAVKAAFVKLGDCPSMNEDGFKDLLRKISENPDYGNYLEFSDFNSECQSDAGLELDKKGHDTDMFNKANIVEMMLERLRCLKENELASLATIVATSGLNAALAESEVNNKQKDYVKSNIEKNEGLYKQTRRNSIAESQARRRVDAELPSLDKFLVKKLTRLEREVLESKNARKNESTETKLNVVKNEENAVSHDLGSVLVKHTSKLEKEVEEARMNNLRSFEVKNKNNKNNQQEVSGIPSLDKYLVKRLSKLEREVQESRSRNSAEPTQDKENVDLNKKETNYESLDKVLVKHVSRLERAKLEFRDAEEQMGMKVKGKGTNRESESSEGSLDQVLVRHKSSRLEREKMAAVAACGREQVDDDDDGKIIRHYSVSRRQAREKELQNAWGGLSLGNSMIPTVSRLERDKAAWIKAEEEERKRDVEQV